MRTLNSFVNETRPAKPSKRVGRGPGSGTGKTSGRGHKGAGSRSGYRRRLTYEGGQMRLFQKLPKRGFTRGRFRQPVVVVNLGMIDRYFQDGEEVNEESLRKHGLVTGRCAGVKLLAKGRLTKKIGRVEVTSASAAAKQQLEEASIPLVLSTKT